MAFKPGRGGSGGKLVGVRVGRVCGRPALIIGGAVLEEAKLSKLNKVAVLVGDEEDYGHVLLEPLKNGGNGYRLIQSTPRATARRVACFSTLVDMGVTGKGDVPWQASKGKLIIDLRTTIGRKGAKA